MFQNRINQLKEAGSFIFIIAAVVIAAIGSSVITIHTTNREIRESTIISQSTTPTLIKETDERQFFHKDSPLGYKMTRTITKEYGKPKEAK